MFKKENKVKRTIEETNFDDFYKKYNKKVYNYIFYKTKDDAVSEEIMQDSFLTLYNFIEDKGSKQENELKNIVLTIARNILMSYSSKIKRRNNKFNENITEIYEERIVNPEEVVENKETADEMYKALNKISELQREAIILVKLKFFCLNFGQRIFFNACKFNKILLKHHLQIGKWCFLLCLIDAHFSHYKSSSTKCLLFNIYFINYLPFS